MAKDPAFLFYSNDFLSGVADLTMEERGQFITLLCLQHQKGHLTDKTIRLSVGSVSVDVLKKFERDDMGFFFNKVLDEKIEERRNFTNSRRVNGMKGGRPKASGYPNGKPKNNLPEDVNENVIVNDNRIKNEVWENVKRNFFNAYEWQEKFCRDKNILLPTLKIRMQEFISDVELKEDWKDLRELKSHFTNLFNKNKNGFKPTQTGRQRGTSQLIEIIKQDFAAGRKKDNGT